jgi:DNA-binding IclR family transcriptional regulator
MGVGSYALSLGERERLKEADPKTAAGLILRLFRTESVLSYEALLSRTGLPPAMMDDLVHYLIDNKFLTGERDAYRLTELGYRAQSIVAA